MKNFKIIFISLLAVLVLAACNELEQMGIFDLDETYLPDARIDGPENPATFIASYDEYCDKIVLSWVPTVRTTSYNLYKDGTLLAGDLADTSYVDMEAIAVDTEYWVVSKNEKGESQDSTFAIGRMAETPSTPANFLATEGEYADKVSLTWDPADFAIYYIISREGVVIADSALGTTYVDSNDPPETATEYSIKAVSVCGESGMATSSGYSDPLVAFRVPFVEDFEGYPVGPLTTLESFGGFRPRFQFQDAPHANGFVEIKDDNSKYVDLSLATGQKSIQFIFPEFDSLLVGESYTLSFDIKAPQTVSLHMGTDVSEDGFMGKFIDNYFIPTLENEKNGNAWGLELLGTGEWKSYSFDFPQTGDGVPRVNATDPMSDPDLSALTLRTIEEGEQKPIIQFQMWSEDGTYAIDNIKIELVQ
jgi:hypothetical protein